MGLSPFGNCSGGYAVAPAPNPDPSRWNLLFVEQFKHAYLIAVRYLDCTNFEGVKVMVFRGTYVPRERMDPHFSDGPESPVARFRPDADGFKMARALAMGMP